MLFTLEAIKKIADSERVKRGRAYFETNRVGILKIDNSANNGLKIEANVKGIRTYRTALHIDPLQNRVLDWECTCPYEGYGACKHVVAVGWAYVKQSINNWSAESDRVGSAPQSAQFSKILEHFLRKNHLEINPESIQALSHRLALVGSAAQKKPKTAIHPIHRKYNLDNIRILLSYDKINDLLAIKPEAVYGRHVVSLCADHDEQGNEPAINGRPVVYHINRDLYEERECLDRLDLPFSSTLNAVGEYHLQGQQIYSFVKGTLQDLHYRYEVIADPTVDPILDIAEDDVTGAWKTSSTGIDFFDFQVEWHCANADIKLGQLQNMMERGENFIRRDDGSFVELGNSKEVRQWLEFLQNAAPQEDGRFRTRLFRVPEMLHLIKLSDKNRLEAMDGHFNDFLNESKLGKPVEKIELPANLSQVLRPYQKRGVEWGVFLRKYHFGGILADDMGLGKTLQALTLLYICKLDAKNHLATKSKPLPSLVICPKTLISTWQNEAAAFVPGLKTLVIEGPSAERKKQMENISQADLVITSYPVILRDMKQYLNNDVKFYYCILDEAQYIKNSGSDTAKAVKLIPAELRLALSGTPLENGIHELWSIFDFLMPGFLGDLKTFRTRFQKPIQDRNDAQALEMLKAKIRPFVLRRTKSTELKDLPAKIEQVRTCSLTPEQLILYTQTMDAVKNDVFRAVKIRGFKRAQIEILTALLRLRQICNHPALVLKNSKNDPGLSGKMPYALEIIEEAVEGGHKILLFSAFTSMLDIIREELELRRIGYCTIEGKTRNRAAQIKRFINDPDAHVFLLSLKAGGVGLTLTAADTVILFDPWWNPMVENQAMDRTHRIGQTRTVNVYKLVTKGTIEEKVQALQERKRHIFEAVMTESGSALESLTWEDIQNLFE